MESFHWIVFLAILLCHNAFANNPMENEGLFEGDIAGIDPYILTDRNAVVDEAQLWPDGIVHYEIDWKLTVETQVSREVGGRGIEVGGLLNTHRVFSLKIGVEPSQNALSSVWCSKLQLTTGVHLILCHDEFRNPRSDIV
ncbi:metalloendopeptidase [Trichonephila clavipes]|nr:metalloendopeptidase [Trichonephila clavipes]